MTAWVLGFDLSLTAPAAVALPLDWKPGDWRRVKSWLIHPKAPKGDDARGQLERYSAIADWASDVVRDLGHRGPASARTLHGFVEAYGFSKSNAGASKLMESGGIVKLCLFDFFGTILTPVPASAARKILLGKVPRSDQKTAVQLALFAAGAPKKWEENICDAMCVCNAGLSMIGGVALATGSE